MKTLIAAAAVIAATLGAATPALAGYTFATVDGPGPATLGTVVTSINDGGHAAGYFVTYDPAAPPGAGGDYTGFTVNADGSGFTAFTRPGYAQTGAAGINNAGDVAGVSVTAGGVGTGFVRSGITGTFTDIAPTFAGSYYSEAIGINNSGAVTGYYVTDPAATVATLAQYAHGFIDAGGTYTKVDVDAADGYGTQVTSINDFGVFTGSYLGAIDGLAHAFLGTFNPVSHAVTVTPLAADPFGSPSASLGDITNNGLVAYNSVQPFAASPTGFVSAAFVLDLAHGGVTPLAAPGALFTNAFGVNQSGQVTGFYLDATGLHGFIATSVPEPAAWGMMIGGFGLIGAVLRRREPARA